MSNTSPRPVIPGRICPSCGTRIADTASHCAACGMVFKTGTGRALNIPSQKYGSPTGVSLPIGIVIGGPIILLIAAALIVVFLIHPGAFPGKLSTPTVPQLPTSTITFTLLPTNTLTILPTPSSPSPIVVTVAAGDTCYGLAGKYGYHNPGVMTDKNGQTVDCSNLQPGEVIYIPRPVSTQPPPSTTDQKVFSLTETACPIAIYTVVYGDTLGGIAANYQVSIESIKRWNPQYPFANDSVWDDAQLRIPLCERFPTESATPTPA